MSVAGGPRLEGVGRPGNMPMRLVLDAGFHDSFAGEMATNKLTSPDINGRFTTGNWWGTYGTNQYNSATYFDIGTISSVSGNQVTMSSWARTLYTFDCLRPQTTGGGVAAGTNYFIFFIGGTSSSDSNVFEIYTYNASQNGTQGYINPATGYPAVYDGILGNGRTVGGTTGSAGSGIVTLTGTPTDMWWGPPHTPNVALVKEVVPNGGRIKGTPCLRIHKPRYWRGFVGDGWAYGPNATGITQGDTIRLSFWYRPSPYGFGGWYTKGGGASWSTHFSGGAGSSSSFTFSSTIGDWRYETYTWTASVTYGFIFYFWPYNASTAQYSIDICDLMYTINDGGAVPWCNVRDHRNTGDSSTGGWFDVSYSGNSGDFNEDMGPADLYHFQGRGAQVNGMQQGGADMHIMVNTDGSAATDSTIGTAGTDPMFIDFDGTDSQFDITHNADFLTAKTWELWVKFDSFPASSTFDTVWQKSPNWNYADTIGMNLIYGNFRWSFGHHWGGAIFSAISSLSTGVWYHAVGTVDIANPTMTSRSYLNGVATGTQSNPYSDRPTNTSNLILGTGSGGNFNGQIANFRVYAPQLTADQVKSNFNSQRSKFKV